MAVTQTIHFDIQRKIVSNMTSESWETIPHASFIYDADVTEFMKEYKKLNQGRTGKDKITVNTLMLKVIVEGLKAAPMLNGTIDFNRRLVRGRVDLRDDINISMPMILPNGKMMTINLHNFENKSLTEMTEYIADVSRRAQNTDLTEAMFEVSMNNTIEALKHGKVATVINRLIGSKTGKHKVKTLHGKAKKEYYSIPESDRLTYRDIEQGTVTISNIGSIYRQQKGAVALLEIVPPQVTAFGVGAVQDKPVVITDEFGEKRIEARQVLPICIAFDHRALDFGDIVPFLKTLDNIFENPKIMHSWKGQEKNQKIIAMDA